MAQSIISPPPQKAADYLNSATFVWLWNYLKVAMLPRHAFPSYAAPPASRPGMFELANVCKVALAGDWGTGTESAYKVMDQIRLHQKPMLTIHLGDIYYSGTVKEVQDYFLGPDDWYRAKQSFALNGNHEMYSGGNGYFDEVLPALNQETSYFCLQNPYWRVVAVDTGYYSKVFPFLELLLGTRLHDENVRWLAEVIFSDPSDRRPVILLSHHQWFSAFDRGYGRIGDQLRPFLGDVVLWFWGHEHRFAGYAPYAPDGRLPIRARCIGHGGMPVEFEPIAHKEVPLVFTDERQSGIVDDDPIGYCGNALLEFNGPSLSVRYFDELGGELLVETWMSGGSDGGARGEITGASTQLRWLQDSGNLVR